MPCPGLWEHILRPYSPLCLWVGGKGTLQLSWVIASWVELKYLFCEWLVTFFTLPVLLERGNRGPEWLRPAPESSS